MKPNKLLSFFPVLIILLAVFMLNMTFAPKISGGIMITIRILLIALFFTAWRILHRKKETHAESIAFTLMVINLAFFIVSFFTTDLWNLNLESPKGIVFILGLIWGFLMYFSRSIIASLLFHAGADLMIIIPIYSSFGVSV